MPKPFLIENNSGTVYLLTWGWIRGFISFPTDISKCNSTTGVKTHYYVAVQHVSQHTTGTPLSIGQEEGQDKE